MSHRQSVGEPATVGFGMRQSVLVIDDESDLRDVLEATLSTGGYSVHLASGGKEGLRTFCEARPDLIILDIIMPDMSGWTVLERIREVSDTPVIMLTALGEERNRIRGPRGGADDYIPKPFSTEELLARCEAVLRRRARHLEKGSGPGEPRLPAEVGRRGQRAMMWD